MAFTLNAIFGDIKSEQYDGLLIPEGWRRTRPTGVHFSMTWAFLEAAMHDAKPAAPSGARVVRAPRGNVLACRNWQIEAAYRMIQNNLDPEVAERPDDLVVYGGMGRAARNWECFDRILAALQ